MSNTEKINKLIYSTCEQMDDENYKSFLKLCHVDYNYKITAYSNELDKLMVWLNYDYAGMKGLFAMINKHVRMTGSFMRHVGMIRIENSEHNEFKVRSNLMVSHTDIKGKTALFAVGEYHDIVINQEEKFLLKTRTVHLKTRDLGPGVHIPF